MKAGDKVYILADTRIKGKGINDYILFGTLVEELNFITWKVETISRKTGEKEYIKVKTKNIYPTFEIALYAMDARVRKSIYYHV